MEIRDCPAVLEMLRKHRNAMYEATKQFDALITKLTLIHATDYESALMKEQARSLVDARNCANQSYQQLDPIIANFERADRR